MAEQRMRELGRDGGVAWLRERERRGDLARWRIELAAYCGSAEARELELCICYDAGPAFCHACLLSDGCSLDRWLRGLERWPGALLRAAIAAARATLPVSCCGETHPECKRSCQQEAEVIDAAERWLNDPTEENRKAWDDLWEVVHPWAHLPTAPDLGSYNGVVEGDIGAAAELIGEQRVREAICGRLREWAIG